MERTRAQNVARDVVAAAVPGRAVRPVMRVLGCISLVAGTRGLLAGAREVPHPGVVTASVDSEYRFYAAWYSMFGVALLSESTQPTVDRRMIRLVSGGFALAALGRSLSIHALGRPARSQIALLLVEACLAAALPTWFERASAGSLPVVDGPGERLR